MYFVQKFIAYELLKATKEASVFFVCFICRINEKGQVTPEQPIGRKLV